jgi:PIN domain nuclease of toxin-antitoxin system
LILLDTHVWLWWISEPSLLSRSAAATIDAADRIGVSSISCFEVATAAAKGRISMDRDVLEWIEDALTVPRVELVPLTPRIAVKATQLGRFHGDPADRLIVATAILESTTLVTKDRRIRKYPAISTVW